MRFALAGFLFLHGAIHVLGFLKGLGFADLPMLKQPIRRAAGFAWLLAALGFVVAAALVLVVSAHWWQVGLPVVVLSQVLIVQAWSDARFGTLPNLVVLVTLFFTILEASPTSFRSLYQASSAKYLMQVKVPTSRVTLTDLEPLPPLIRRYLIRVGIVGKPRVQGFFARFQGRFRNGFDGPWMTFTSEQHDFVNPSARFFLMRASQWGIPITGFHSFSENEARMRIQVASVFDVVDARGPEMNQGETVTLFNDLCLFAPAVLVDLPVQWTTLDATRVRGVWTRGAYTVSAVLLFNSEGDVVDFVSEDRFHSADGKTYLKMPWKTPVRGYRELAGLRLPMRGDATWVTPAGDFVYGEFSLVEIAYLPSDQPN